MTVAQPTFTVQTTSAFSRANGIKFLVYGRPDSGKTYLSSTMPNPLIIATEKGLMTLSKVNLPYIVVDSIQSVSDIVTWLCEDNYKNIAQYDSICVDGISFLTYQILSELKTTVEYKDPRKYYGDLSDIVKPFVECIVNLPKHVYMTAWEGDILHPATKQSVGICPETAGKQIQTYLNHFFDQTMHLAWHVFDVTQADGTVAKQRVSYLQTRDVGNGIFARDRTGALEVFETADLSAIINKLLAAQK